MRLLTRLAGIRADVPKSPIDDYWYSSLGGTTAAGVTMSPELARTLSAVYRAERVRTETLATLPCITYRSLPGDDGRERATDHPLYEVLRRQPNRWQTGYQFWEMAQGHVDMRGDFYAHIQVNPRPLPPVPGQTSRAFAMGIELVPMHPDRMTPEWTEGGAVRYVYKPAQGPPVVYPQSDIFHIAGPSYDGLKGESIITCAREGLGGARALDLHGARFFANGAATTGALEHPGVLGDPALKRLREQWADQHAGIGNAWKPIILEEGMKWQSIGMNMEDSQWIESRKFAIEEIARWFSIPLHMMGQGNVQPRANMEQEALEFVQYTMLAIVSRIEGCIWRDLIIDKANVYSKFLLDSLLRGDLESRYRAYAIGRNWGWLSINDVRRKEDENPIGPEGDIYLTPLNMQPAGTVNTPAPTGGVTPGGPGPPGGARALATLRQLAADAAGRLVRKEIAAMTRLARATADDPAAWRAGVTEFYQTYTAEISSALHVDPAAADGYCRAQCDALIWHGAAVMAEWPVMATRALADLAMAAVEGGPGDG